VRSKDCTAASRAHSAHAPPLQLGPTSYLLYTSVFELSQGKTLVFPQPNLFLEPQLSCPMSFYSVMSLLLILSLKIKIKTLDAPVYSLQFQLQSSQRANGRAPLCPPVRIRRGGAVPPLHPLYDSPFTVIRRGTHSFTLQAGTREEIVTVNRL
jgi:hypothetical protein